MRKRTLFWRVVSGFMGRDGNGRGPVRPTRRLRIEELDARCTLLSGITAHTNVALGLEPDGAPLPPSRRASCGLPHAGAALRKAYGIDTLINAGDNGSQQTIAIVDAYLDPNITADAAAISTNTTASRSST